MNEAQRYRSICLGITVEGPAEVFCDNMSVVKNLIIPTSALKKSHIAIFYHRLREDQAASILWVVGILEEFNMTDLFAKTTIPGNIRHNLVDSIFSNTTSPIGEVQNNMIPSLPSNPNHKIPPTSNGRFLTN